ncbi:Uncharacterized protein dnm_014270 [Desulfonema magnum]|uniref:Uncharacterized protein n=1 Tax=Desulfonema magnum TaxID=45655 RepID=A0A975BHK0_9BACT|nr:Uncharacterized protein dnm_014270 [Desulfonema magnum]
MIFCEGFKQGMGTMSIILTCYQPNDGNYCPLSRRDNRK